MFLLIATMKRMQDRSRWLIRPVAQISIPLIITALMMAACSRATPTGVTPPFSGTPLDLAPTDRSLAETPSVHVEEITVRAPITAAAGTPFTVTVASQRPVDHAPTALFLINTNGTRLLAGELQGGHATIPVHASMTEVAGAMELIAQVGNTVTGRTTIMIVPGAAVEPVLALVGPRSITADGEHWTMLTALPADRFGNAVSDGTAVVVRVLHPAADGAAQRTQIDTYNNDTGNDTGNDTFEVLTANTNYLLAWVRVFSRTIAGRMDMAATAGMAHSPERTVIAVPGPPVTFGLQATARQRDADGRHLITVETARLQDRFGNPLLDGTAVTFLVTNPDGSRRSLSSQSIAGKASIPIQVPTLPGSLQIEALVLNTMSQPLLLDFSAGIGITAIAVRAIPTDDLLTLIAGPLLGPLEQYIPDGSDVSFTIQSTEPSLDVIEVIAPAAAGFATAVIRTSILPAGRYRVLVQAGIGTGEMMIEIEE